MIHDLTTSPRACLLSLLAVMALCAASCSETLEPPADEHQETVSFAVTTRIELDTSHVRDTVQIDSVYLGIGSVLLEPLDDLEAPLLATRSAVPVHYTADGTFTGVADAEPIEGVAPGRYLVSLAVQPIRTPMWSDSASLSRESMRETESVAMDGRYFVVMAPPEVSSPEPLPWRPRMLASSQWDVFEFGRVREIPFTYRTTRTGYIRVGEIQLSEELNHIELRIDLEAWLDQALTPVLVEAVATRSATSPNRLDVSSRLESTGSGLERLFRFSTARALIAARCPRTVVAP